MSAGVLPPVLKMTLCRQRVRLAAVARLAGQHKVMHEVSGVLGEGDEVIHISIFHLPAAVKAAVVN